MTAPRDTAALDPQLLERARRWALEEPNAQHAATLTAELEAAEGGDVAAAEAVRSRFSGPLTFGTAGLRAEEGPGESRMNRLVVRRAAAGIARYLLDTLGEDEAPPSVVIGYDARHGSASFARDSAGVFTAAGAQVTLLPRPLPTPVLAFLVRHLNADAGVMVTASHNPPADNGYKVYLGGRMTDAVGRGAQIVSPADAEIAARIDHEAWFADIPMANSGWDVADEELVEAYSEAALGVLDEDRREATGRDALTIVYTPMHGVGAAVLPGLLERAGFTDVHVVARQAEPDPDFPTVAFPNPEEPGALDLSFDAAAELGADLVIANDPDADRLALAAAEADGTWRMLSGDQVGALLGAHLLPRLEALGRSTACSIVSSPQLSRLAEHAGVPHHATLTGFKWISRAPQIGYGYEEALGYCVAPDLVRDKDGMTAALVAADLAAGLKAEGRSVWDALADLDATTGAMPSAQVSVRVEDVQIIADAMARLRSEGIAELAGDPVTASVDLAAGSEDLPPTDGLLFSTDTGTRVVIRPSGTEPKLKCYLGTTDEDPQTARTRLAAVRDQIAALVAG
ncbi:phosphomannomutase [Micrococcus sp. HMSC067E09]|uniref:phospho-sugar mutase n=1 Tax=Micrococcus sp. HMSC067E09 TaxID=1739367 RepID=UPI0008A40F3A|nr:phospho-sugar mutase [Micrococcus sp. HMSC067E09]OFR90810.1 phosphomannomutase [Micrococcus sp. HMSC067E09]